MSAFPPEPPFWQRLNRVQVVLGIVVSIIVIAGAVGLLTAGGGGGKGGGSSTTGGITGTTPSPPPPVEVPDVIGESRHDAEARLITAGLSAHVALRVSNAAPATVLDQSPPAGTSLERGRAVDLIVARPQPQTGLSELNNNNRVQSDQSGSVDDSDTLRVQVGTAYGRSTTVVVTNAEFGTMQGTVKIDPSAECAQNDGEVWISDPGGGTLWPRDGGRVRISSAAPKQFSIDVAGLDQVKLETHALTKPYESPCSGDTRIAWESVALTK